MRSRKRVTVTPLAEATQDCSIRLTGISCWRSTVIRESASGERCLTNSPGFSVFRTAWSTTNRFSSSPWWIESCVTSVSAAAVDIEAIKIRLRYGLRGLSFFGLIEPAYYANLEQGIYPQRRCISWHLHALVWGISQRKLRALLRALQAAGRYAAVVPGLKAVDVREVQQGDLPTVVGYILKSPWSAYRVTKYVADQRGYLLRDADGKERPFYLQGKSKLQPGQRITLFHLLKSFYLDKLSVAGGEGAPLLAAR